MTQAITTNVGVAQLDGNPIDLGAGAAGVGTQRTIMASDSPLVTTATALVTGATPFTLIATGLTEDKTVVKASPGRLMSLSISNVNAAPCFVKFYDKITAPVVASDTPIATFLCPGATAGGVRDPKLPSEGIAFSVGIAFVIVALVAITDGTEVAANEVVINGSYK